MKFVNFVKWFAKHPSKNIYKFFGALALIVGMTMFAHIREGLTGAIWVAYPIELLFGGGYLFAQWHNYKKMKEAEEKKNKKK